MVSPDGSWILYLSRATPEVNPTTPVRIMRVPTSGGPPQLVLEGRGINRLSCARSPATLCVFSEESPDYKQLIFSAFEPSQEQRRRELTRVNLRQPVIGYGWDLSLDGSRLAFTQSDEREGRIQILPLAGGEVREVNVKGWNGLSDLFWAADGKGLFVSKYQDQTGSRMLLYVDLEGRARSLAAKSFRLSYRRGASPPPTVATWPCPATPWIATCGCWRTSESSDKWQVTSCHSTISSYLEVFAPELLCSDPQHQGFVVHHELPAVALHMPDLAFLTRSRKSAPVDLRQAKVRINACTTSGNS